MTEAIRLLDWTYEHWFWTIILTVCVGFLLSCARSGWGK